jgi:tRNA-splicing ligase RtcB
MTEKAYNVITPEGGVLVKAWTKGVALEDAAREQLLNVARLRRASNAARTRM